MRKDTSDAQKFLPSVSGDFDILIFLVIFIVADTLRSCQPTQLQQATSAPLVLTASSPMGTWPHQ